METREKLRWYCPTPGWLVYGSLAVTGLLFLSNWLGWPAWHKGYAVLTCVASVAAILVLMLLWFVAAVIFRLRFQFSIRTLLVLVVTVALPFNWLAYEIQRAKPQRQTIETMQTIWRDVPGAGFGFCQALPPETPPWMESLLDYGGPTWKSLLWDNCVIDDLSLRGSSVTDRELEQCVKQLPDLRRLELCKTRITDGGLKKLKALAGLVYLYVGDSKITDAGLNHLKDLAGLQQLKIFGTQVTDIGVQKLRQALPRCQITTDVDGDGDIPGGLFDFKIAMPIFIELLNDDRSSVREAATMALGREGAKAKAAVPALTGLLKDKNPDVRKAAREALEKVTGLTAE